MPKEGESRIKVRLVDSGGTEVTEAVAHSVKVTLISTDAGVYIGNIGHNITTITSGRKVVTTAATRETLVASTTPAKWVIITAETDNTGVIAVGAVTVVATVLTRVGIPLLAGDSITLPVDDLLDVYLDSTVSGDGVTYIALS